MLLGNGRNHRKHVSWALFGGAFLMLFLAMGLVLVPAPTQTELFERAFEESANHCEIFARSIGVKSSKRDQGIRVSFELHSKGEAALLKIDAIQGACSGFTLERACVGPCPGGRQFVDMRFKAWR